MLAVAVAACSSDEGGSTNLFGPSVEQVVVEVDYAAGAAPFDAYPARGGSPWELLEENGAHCTNDRCVMYWPNERVADAVQFARERLMGEDTLVFWQEFLDDAYAAAAAESFVARKGGAPETETGGYE